MNKIENNETKIQEKLEEMKRNRSKKTTLDVNYVGKIDDNFKNASDEMRKICELHRLIPVEIAVLGNQLVWLAQQVSINIKMNQLIDSIEKSDIVKKCN